MWPELGQVSLLLGLVLALLLTVQLAHHNRLQLARGGAGRGELAPAFREYPGH